MVKPERPDYGSSIRRCSPHGNGYLSKIDPHDFSHNEGLCFGSITRIFLVDEWDLGFLGREIYSMDLSAILATFGAKVLHPRGIKYEPKPAAMSGIRFLFRRIGNIQSVTAVL